MNSDKSQHLNLAQILIQIEKGDLSFDFDIQQDDSLPAFIIYIDKRRDKLEQILASSADASLHMYPCKAVTPTDLANSKVLQKLVNRSACEKYGGRSCSNGEMCCFLSHLALWKLIGAYNLNHAVVFEDDMEIIDSAYFNKITIEFRRHTRVSQPATIFKLSDPNKLDHTPTGVSMHRLFKNHKGAGCYLLNRPASELLVSKFQTVQEPLDHFLFHPRNNKIAYWTPSFLPTQQLQPADSTLAEREGKHRWWKRLPHYKNTALLTLREDLKPVSRWLGLSV